MHIRFEIIREFEHFALYNTDRFKNVPLDTCNVVLYCNNCTESDRAVIEKFIKDNTVKTNWCMRT